MCNLLRIVGIPIRFLLFLCIVAAIGMVEPDSLSRLDTDWQWVRTGATKHDRQKNAGRQPV